MSIKVSNQVIPEGTEFSEWQPRALDLSPAHWIWFPSQRTLPNTFVLFRRELALPAVPVRAAGWLTADSRYRLTVNGQRVQWGPAPCDPRQLDVDPVDLAPYLWSGCNVLGVEVLYYGLGEGTWVTGKPGFIFYLDLEYSDGRCETVVSDAAWLAGLDRAHRPGQYKRWFLRALQEEFDARLHPYGWDAAGFALDERWLPALALDGPADKPPICTRYADYLNDSFAGGVAQGGLVDVSLRARQIPPLREIETPALALAESGRIEWLRDPLDWFEFRTPGSFQIVREPVAVARDASWELPAATGRSAVFATFEFKEQLVGWPYFTIEAPEGTVVEVMSQEAHNPEGPAWLDTHWYSWSRFICREGVNRFEAFDFESLRWLQFHIRNASRPVMLSGVGVRRRVYAWPNKAHVRCSEPALQRLFDASLNTLCNSAQEVCADGFGRERQQTSGDVGHQLRAIRYAFGETRLPARFLRTYSSSLTVDGFFLDVWPAADTLSRMSQRQVGATFWGPILDHGIQLVFDCWYHYLETGDLKALEEPYPRLLRFAAYLERLRRADGLLPVEDIGLTYVWMDHDAYQQQRYKQCAFNLYAAAMFEHALAPIARAFGEAQPAERFVYLGREILAAAVRRFWDAQRGLFVNNLPWSSEETGIRLCDRSLANAILFDQCPGAKTGPALRALAECPPELGRSFPANAGWRYWALAHLGREDVIIKEFRERWATLDSVTLNNTIQESWHARPDTTDEWSHCAVVPTYVLLMDIAGIRPAAPGFTRCQIRPQLGDLGSLDLIAHTVQGPIHFAAESTAQGHHVSLALPPTCSGELLLPAGGVADLLPLEPDHPLGLKRFRLELGQRTSFSLPRGCPSF